jgi:hypothetical protein
MKIDLRHKSRRVAQLQAVGHNLISYAEGENLGREIGAKYYECSAVENTNVTEVIQAATRAAMTGNMRRLQKKICNLL